MQIRASDFPCSRSGHPWASSPFPFALPSRPLHAWLSTALLSTPRPHSCRWPSFPLDRPSPPSLSPSLYSLLIGYSFPVARFPEGTALSQSACLPLAAPREGRTATGRGGKCKPPALTLAQQTLRWQAGPNCPALGQRQIISVNDDEDKQGRSKLLSDCLAPGCQKLGVRRSEAPTAGQRKGQRGGWATPPSESPRPSTAQIHVLKIID